MEGESHQILEPGDLVFMREFDDVLGWVTRKDIIFIILGVQRGEPRFRDMVHFSGGEIVGETFAAYFVKIDSPNI